MRRKIVIALLTLGSLACGAPAASVDVSEPSARAAAPPQAREPYRCVVESWSQDELGTATGVGPDARSAHDDAQRQLCPTVSEPCPTEALFVAFAHTGGGPPRFQDGVRYRLVRLAYASHTGESGASRAQACAAAERAFRATAGPTVRALSGVNGLRWLGSRTGVQSARALLEAIGQLPDASSGERFECGLQARVSPVLWQREMAGNAGEACLSGAPPDLASRARRSSTRCDASGVCTTHCALTGEESEVSVKGRSTESQRAACVAAAAQLCAGSECMVELTHVDGIAMPAFAHSTTRTVRTP